jgi:Xaa-Pro aminopeptidase
MHREQRQRAHEYLKSQDVERALFANPATVRWLTGFAPPIQVGTSIFAGGPPLLWHEDGRFTLIVMDSHVAAAGAFGGEPDGEVVSYLGYTIEQPIASQANLVAGLRQQLERSKQHTGKIGIEEYDLPIFLWQAVRAVLAAHSEPVAIDGWFEPLRMVKTAEELAKLKENFALCDIGHAAARRAVAAGLREIDIWTTVHSAIEQAAGQRVPLGNDCVVGHRQNNIGGWPSDEKIGPNDSLIVDLSTILHGYWSDGCGTYYAGEPTPLQQRMHRTVQDCLDFAMSLVRPGAVAREIDARVRQFIADAGYPVYPHHTGHSVGVTSHEAPRIVPYNDQTLQAGMVIMLEPGIYFPGETSVRLEDAVLVTADGAQVLTHHDKSLP